MAETKRFKFDLPALRVLENEHQYLSYLMDGWHTSTPINYKFH